VGREVGQIYLYDFPALLFEPLYDIDRVVLAWI
jgi:hypothetical protein